MEKKKVATQWHEIAYTRESLRWWVTPEWKEKELRYLQTALGLKGHERILDLACGEGKRALFLAQRGFSVVGVDLAENVIIAAREQAYKQGVRADFISADFRSLTFDHEFDVVLSMGDGAIGYLEAAEENQKIFAVIARALKPGGKHLMDIPNKAYARQHFPLKLWLPEEDGITLLDACWQEKTQRVIIDCRPIRYGTVFRKEAAPVQLSQILYTVDELQQLLNAQHMDVLEVCGDFERKCPPSPECHEIVVLSVKRGDR
uniref:Methyltransferase type 11 n=1 Tax=Thermosporothrix sp. COM3 TaxID=2490863 RepID=A0A455SG62_9CHLR|nr:methyltransferase type 11 [Thermosporothrix sp. COM3]